MLQLEYFVFFLSFLELAVLLHLSVIKFSCLLPQAVREMDMLSTSVLNIKWTIQGKPKLPPASVLGGELVLAVNSTFTMNQISGQVILHEDEWDLSASHLPTQAYFYTTRLAFSAVEAGKDVAEFAQGLMRQLDKGGDNNLIYPDPSGDPKKVSPQSSSFPRFRISIPKYCC